MAKIAFIGGGNMSSCVYAGIRKARGYEDEIFVSGPHIEKLDAFKNDSCTVTTSNVEVFKSADIIFLGVKPQVLPEVFAELKANISEDVLKTKLVVSMAAGWKMSAIYNHLGECRLIRIIPNTPAKIGLGIISLSVGHLATKEDATFVENLLAKLGMVLPMREDKINAMCAVAGSGPAFVFRFMEALIANTKECGFSEDEAREIVCKLMLGSTMMVENNKDVSVGALREAVTSKGGTTYQGLLQMTEYKFEEMIDSVMKACVKRSEEMEASYK